MFVGLLHLSEQIVFMPAVNQHQEVKYASVNSDFGFRPQNKVKRIDFFLKSENIALPAVKPNAAGSHLSSLRWDRQS